MSQCRNVATEIPEFKNSGTTKNRDLSGRDQLQGQGLEGKSSLFK